MRRLRIVNTLFLGFFLLFAKPIFAEKAITQAKPEAANSHWKVSLKTVVVNDIASDFNKLFVFDIINKRLKRHSQFTMRNMTTEVKSLMIVNKKLIISGRVKSNLANGITIVDMSQLKEIDYFLCYNPKLSPNKRFIVYEKFYPRFSPKEAQSSLILLYDMHKTPRENRLRKKGIPTFDIHKSGTISHITEVGLPIFPVSNAEEKTYRVWVDDVEKGHRVFPHYLWLNDDTQLLFIDYHDEDNWVVSIQLDSPYQPRITKDIIENTLPYSANDQELKLKIKSLEKTRDDRLKINLYVSNNSPKSEIILDLPTN
jgi:hypothetical protein